MVMASVCGGEIGRGCNFRFVGVCAVRVCVEGEEGIVVELSV